MTKLAVPDRLLFGLIAVALVLVLGYAALDLRREFGEGFAAEDGLIEYASAIFLLTSAVVLGRRGWALASAGRMAAAALVFLYALAFVFGAGEEISWGQRLFGIETPEALRERNVQGEITLHNLAWDDTHIAHTIFGNGLSAVILVYLVVLPFLYPRVGWIARLADTFMVPVPSARHAIATLAASAVMMIVDLPRQWEVYEFVFALLTLSIFLYPANAARFETPARG